MNAVNCCLCFGLFAVCSNTAMADDFDANVDLNLAASVFQLPDTNEWQPFSTISTKLNAWLYPSENTEVSIRYGLSANGAESESFLQQMTLSSDSRADYLIGDNSSVLWQNSRQTLSLSHQLEQLLATFWFEDVSLNVGRQAISLGTSKVFSPADVIAPSSFDFSFSGYRMGVDAVRLTWYVGPTSELDAGLIKGQDSAVFARFKTNAHAFDVDVTAIQLDESLGLLSIGLIGGMGTIGLWQESALYSEEGDWSVRSSLGADTTVFADLYVMAEYHFNGLGKPSGEYYQRFESQFYRQGSIQPAGRHYLSMIATKPINALLTGQVNWVTSIEDLSGVALLGGNLSVSDNATAALNASIPYSKSNDANTFEYGAFPLGINASLNWVF
ncbi:hypothetical protein QWZ13_08205 [Reinekea marina]|uniref:DUF5723 domain-containing protein n=1 Tax=Reinekea marina TaxID=1310421 RepID=A0ABV7WTQ9_9GAMM|nr:hypothetical protein [Reinekea marina]MDN3648892.1 hypothetical protein [Reinekea marina]